MAVSSRIVHASPEAVFAVLADGWLFPAWVVGASRMRSVDDAWPHVGSHLHHSFGVWPAVLDDRTTVLLWDAPHKFVIQPKGWPLGEARVTIEVQPHSRGSRVMMAEHAVKGPSLLVPAPLLWAALRIRNHETLRRLAHLAEGGAGRTDDPDLEPTEADRIDRREPTTKAGTIALVAAAALTAVAVLRGLRR